MKAFICASTCVLSLLALARPASAQCGCGSTPFNCSVSSGDTVCITPTYNSGTGKWDISILATADNSNNVIVVTIEANTDETAVGEVAISSTAGAAVDVRLTLKGTGSTTYLESVDVITQTETGSGYCTLFLLDTEANVGSISINQIVTATVGGNLTGSVQATNGRVGTLTVGGSIAGGLSISAPSGRIDFINVPNSGCDIGASGNLATIAARDELRHLFVADDMWANITVLNGSTYGPVDRIQVGGSYLAGAMHVDWFDDLGAVSSPGLYLTDDLGATLTTEGEPGYPITIGGDTTAAITIGGSLFASFTIEGTSTAPITIEGALGHISPDIAANFHLGTESVTTPITADISFAGNISGGDIKIWQPYAGEFTITGSVLTDAVTDDHRFQFRDDFASDALLDIGGSLSADSQLAVFGTTAGRINIRGDSSGLVRFLDEFQSTAALHIGDSLTELSDPNGGIILFEQTDDLIGQVVINSLHLGTPGEWDGDVRLALTSPIILRVGAASPNNAPHYARPASQIGGGAVGLVPFYLHAEDCIPAHGTLHVEDAFSVTLRFYGPVTWDAGFPFIIEYWNGSSWTNDNAQWSVLSGEGTRAITLLYSDENDPSVIPSDRDYRITPVTTGTNKLLCDDLLTTADVLVGFFTYEFTSY